MLSKSEEKFLNNYRKEVHDPAWRFILRYAIAWTLVFTLVTLVSDYFMEKVLTGKDLWIYVPIYFIGGVAYSSWFRWFAKKRVAKIEKKLSGT